MSSDTLTLGVYASGQAVEAVSSRGHETVIRTQAIEDPAAWLELIVYGISTGPKTELRAAFSFAAGTTREFEFRLRRKAREAGFHKVLVVPAVDAARHGLAKHPSPQVPLIVLDPARSQLAVNGQTDWVRRIPGREARELAVSLRCLLKPLAKAERRAHLETVLVVSDAETLELFGRRDVERQLEAIGARRVEIRHEALALARGALNVGQQTPDTAWRRVSRG